MKEFTYNVNGQMVTVNARDMDRARCAAKCVAGANWTPKAKLVKVRAGAAA